MNGCLSAAVGLVPITLVQSRLTIWSFVFAPDASSARAAKLS
jgi:hypothetical protein